MSPLRSFCLLLGLTFTIAPAQAQTIDPQMLDLDPKLIQSSPVLQRWLRQPPDVAEKIRHDPAFRPRIRTGLDRAKGRSGVTLGLEDMAISGTPLTWSTDYSSLDRSLGVQIQGYILPLGRVLNVAPVLGYRTIGPLGRQLSTEGLEVGLRSRLSLARGGGADITVQQTWLNPRQDSEVARTRLSIGYALTHHLRLATDIQRQNSRLDRVTRYGILLEWMP